MSRQKRLVEISREPIFIWDFDGGIIEWNRGSEELYVYSRAEMVGTSAQTLLITTVPGSSFKELQDRLRADGRCRRRAARSS